MRNPNDEIREHILRYFYDRNAHATSQFGKKGSAAKVSDLKRDLKERFGLSQQQVMSNLTYLIDREWVRTLDIEKTVQTGRGTIPSVVRWYEIGAAGIDRIEGESEFQSTAKYAGINITATGTNVITLGDGNVVNAHFKDLHVELTELQRAIARSAELGEQEKLDVSVDIESLKDQLAKSKPNLTIVKTLWASIENVVTAANLIDYSQRIAPYLVPLLSG